MHTRISGYLGRATGLATVLATASIAAVATLNAAELAGQNVAPAANTIDPSAKATGKAKDQPVATAVSMQEQLLVGDKLQISFFEQLNLGQAVDVGINGDVRTFYQRLDLTGEHLVDADGSIAIPLVGRFVVKGMTADEAQSKIMEAYQQVTGRSGEVHITVLERLPVFVTGIVRNPGAYQFRPGMILAQAIALAGGYDKDAQASARFIEAQRERERHTQAVDRLERLMAKRIRLIQESSLLDDPSKAGSQDQASVDSDDLTAAIDSENQLLKVELAAYEGELSTQDARITSAQQELSTLRSMSELVDRQIDVRAERLRVLQGMQGRGLATLEPLWNAQKDIADFELQRERLAVEIGTAEQNVTDAKAVRTKLVSDRRVANQTELAAVEEEIVQQKAAASTSEEITSALETDMMEVDRGTATLRLVVLRGTGTGTTTLPADEVTSLMPGDVVKVIVSESDQTAQATAAGSL